MQIINMKHHFLVITLFSGSLLTFQQTFAESLSDCYAAIEATDQYMGEGLINNNLLESVEKLVSQATELCEKGLVQKGMEKLTEVNQSLSSEPENNQQVSNWTSDFGNIELIQSNSQVTGYYPNYDGTIKATLLENGALEGYWIQPSSGMKCKSKKEGSFYWGTLTFNQITTDKFKGQYAYCDQAPGSGGAWNGKFKSGTKLTLSQTSNHSLSADLAAGTVFNEYRASFKHGNPVRLEADITCDGINDFIFGWEETMNPDSGGYHLAVVHQSTGETKLTAEKLRISGIEGGAEQWPEICKVPQHFNPKLTTSPMDKEISKYYNLPESCKQMIVLDDGACDKLYMIWNPNIKTDRKLIFLQMN